MATEINFLAGPDKQTAELTNESLLKLLLVKIDQDNNPTYQVLVYSVEGHLAGTVEQVSEADKRISHIHVEEEDSSDERHALDLQETHTSKTYHN